MSRIHEAFYNKKAFIPFFTCGDPDIETTKKLIYEAVKNGADLIELGIPFSDPTAEGPVIQDATMRALEGGMTTDIVFNLVEEIRSDITIPLVFMTYANVVYSYGIEDFVIRCNKVGIDGIILPDVPYEEKGEFQPICSKYGVDFISFIAPTSKERIAMIAKEAEGFLYIVSSLGVTGTRSKITTDLGSIIKEVRKNTDIPCAIGFGISNPKQAKDMSLIADGVIVGSAIVKQIAAKGRDSVENIGQFIKEMKQAIE